MWRYMVRFNALCLLGLLILGIPMAYDADVSPAMIMGASYIVPTAYVSINHSLFLNFSFPTKYCMSTVGCAKAIGKASYDSYNIADGFIIVMPEMYANDSYIFQLSYYKNTVGAAIVSTGLLVIWNMVCLFWYLYSRHNNPMRERVCSIVVLVCLGLLCSGMTLSYIFYGIYRYRFSVGYADTLPSYLIGIISGAFVLYLLLLWYETALSYQVFWRPRTYHLIN